MATTWIIVAGSRRARIVELAGGGPLHEIDDLDNPPGEAALLPFVRELGRRLNQARAGQRYQRLCLIGAPGLLGLLRGHLDKDTLKLLRAEMTTDNAGFALPDIEDCIGRLALRQTV